MKIRLKDFCFALLLVAPASASALAQKPELIVQAGHAGSVGAVACSPDSRVVASAGGDGTIKLWDTQTGSELRTIKEQPARFGLSPIFSPDGRLLAAISGRQTIKLWDVTTGEVVKSLTARDEVISISFRSDGAVLAAAVLFDKSGEIALWDVASGAELRGIKTNLGVQKVLFNPAAGSRTLAALRALGGEGIDAVQQIELWDTATWRRRPRFAVRGMDMSMAFSPDGRVMAVNDGIGLPHGTVTLWSVTTGRLLRTVLRAPKDPSAGGFNPINDVSISPDGKLVAAGGSYEDDGAITLWNAATGKVVRYFGRESVDLEFCRDGRTIVSGGTDVRLWDATTGGELRSLRRYASPVTALAFINEGRTLVAGAGEYGWTNLSGEVKLWNARTSAGVQTVGELPMGITSVVVSPDAKTLATGSETLPATGVMHRPYLSVWSLETGKPAFKLPGGAEPPVSFSPDGKVFISRYTTWHTRQARGGDGAGATVPPGAPEGQAQTPSERRREIAFWDAETGKLLGRVDDGGGAFVFRSDGRVLQSSEGIVRLCAPQCAELSRLAGFQTYEQVRVEEGKTVFSPDAKIIAVGGRYAQTEREHARLIRLWEAETGRELHTLDGHRGLILALAFSPDGSMLASAGTDGIINLWDVATGAKLRTLAGHAQMVASLAFTPDGRVLASGGFDTHVRLWDVSSGQELASLIAVEQKDWLVVTPNGLFDGSPAAWHRVRWRLSQNLFDLAPVESFFNEFYYPDLLADILAGERPRAAQSIGEKDLRQPQLRLAAGDPRAAAGPVTAADMTVSVEVEEAGPDARRPRAGSGAKDVRLFRNGALVKLWPGDAFKLGVGDGCEQRGAGKVVCSAQVPLVAGENRVTAYAFNSDNVKSRDAELPQPVTGAQSLKQGSTMYVLAVGVNKYRDENLNLRLAVKDAEEFGAKMEAGQKGLGNYARTVVVTLRDAEATKTNVMHALKRLATREKLSLPAGALKELEQFQYASANDGVVVYFAGHGVAEGERFYLLTHDFGGGGRRGVEELRIHGISDEELEEAFVRVIAEKMLMVIDACESGQALGARKAGRGPMNSKGLAQLAYDKGMYILTAAQSQQAALEVTELGHGLLTYALVVEGLGQVRAERNERGEITERRWLDYAAGRVPRLQVEQMTKREADLTTGGTGARTSKLLFKAGDDPNLPPEKRAVQVPRVFYRRELEAQPLVVARAPDK